MSLEQRRRIQQLEDEAIPQFKEKFTELCGGSVETAIAWDSFTTISALDDIEHQALGRIYDACRTIGRDDMGKKAVKEIHTVELQQLPAGSAKSIELKDGVLKVHAVWGDSGDFFTDTNIQHYLESVL